MEAQPPSPTPDHISSFRRRSTTMSSILSASAQITSSTYKAAESIGQATLDVLNANPPLGAWAAAAEATSKAPTLSEIRAGSFNEDDGSPERRRALRRNTSGSVAPQRPMFPRSRSSASTTMLGPVERKKIDERGAELHSPSVLLEESAEIEGPNLTTSSSAAQTTDDRGAPKHGLSDIGRKESAVLFESNDKKNPSQYDPALEERRFSSGYIPPPRLPWATASWIGFKKFCNWILTPSGFLITVYCLNVVAWGGMLFLLLCGAAPAMCWVNENGRWIKECNHINSPRRIWLEIDSQILNALFCVTGFGLVPWRFRDLYYLLDWRFCSEKKRGSRRKLRSLRVLAGIHRGWFRLPGHDTLDQLSAVEYSRRTPLVRFSRPGDCEKGLGTAESTDGIVDLRVPLPQKKAPRPPVTGVRAPPTATWKLDFFIWCNVWNTFFQTCLCGFMWGMSRYDRPSWSTGLFIGLACVVAGIGGIASFIEGKRVKKVEGIVLK